MPVSSKDLKEVKEEVFHGGEEKKLQNCVHEPSEDERTHLLQMSEISLWLDTYDDIFSDFDPRPYSQRALSDDFLSEAKKASKEKTSGRIGLIFLIPSEKRNTELEGVIRRRLHEHFRKHYSLLEEEVKKVRTNGVLTALAGFFFMLVASYASLKRADSFFFNVLLVLIEPAGWFITWFGLDQVFYTSNQKKPDVEFYGKMAKCDIEFISLTCPVNPKDAKEVPK